MLLLPPILVRHSYLTTDTLNLERCTKTGPNRAKTQLLMRSKTWAHYANRVLASLFVGGRQPATKEICDAYPFGPRKY